MMQRFGFFILVLMYLELEFDGVRSVPFLHCIGVPSPILSNETIDSSITHCIGIRRFDFITLNETSTVCNSTQSNETLPFSSTLSFPDHQHHCRLNDTATIDKVFGAISCQQKADINNIKFQCSFDVFIFEIDWVPLIEESTTETLFKMTSLCETKSESGLNRISISNDNYELNTTIVANKINCTSQITLNYTTNLVFHTYDNRLIRNQQMSLLYQNGSSVKTWTNMSDLSHIIETETITMAPQTLLLQWNNSAENNGGHFWISIEAVNSSMGFNSGTNVTRPSGFTQSETTTSSTEPTTDNINTATTSTISSTEPTTDNINAATTSTISSIGSTTDNINAATTSTISSIGSTTDNINAATTSTISSIGSTTDNINQITATTSAKETHKQDVTQTVTNNSVIATSGSAAVSSGRSLSTTAKPPCESNDNMVLIIGIVVGILLLILMILFACCVRWYFMKRNRTEPEKDDANRPNVAEKQSPEAHNTEVDGVTTESGNNGLFPPNTKDFISNPLNSRFSNVSRKNTTKTVEDFQQEQVDDATYEPKRMEQEMETCDETADQTHPEKKKKKKKKKKRKRRIEETLDYLLEGDEQNNTTPIED